MIKQSKSGFKKFTPFKPSEICKHPSHKPPMHMVYQPGRYKYECPSCGKVTKFIIPAVTYSLIEDWRDSLDD